MFYLDLFRKLEEHQVHYLVAGGLAMNLHGVPRMTMDIDLLLALDQDNLAAFIEVAGELDLKPVLPVKLADLLDPDIRRHWARERNMIAFGLRTARPHDPVVDILIEPAIDLEKALANAVQVEMEGCIIAVASVDDMIQLKNISNRVQDRSDVAQLLRLKDKS